MGGLADLELGPFARNIMGGKEGAERISKALSRLSKRYRSIKSASLDCKLTCFNNLRTRYNIYLIGLMAIVPRIMLIN